MSKKEILEKGKSLELRYSLKYKGSDNIYVYMDKSILLKFFI